MFKFFPDEDQTSAEKSSSENHETTAKNSKEILTGDNHFKLSKSVKTSSVKLTNSVELKCANLNDLTEHVEDDKVMGILKSSSDLESGVYEGGFKTWECTWDLTTYIEEHFNQIFRKELSSPIKVLDLGCGSGLLGLAVLKMAEENGIDLRVDFHDYNEEVIDNLTIPNALLNFTDEAVSKCRFFSGDWATFNKNSEDPNLCYDLILSSETIYNLAYFDRFLGVINRCLKKNACLYLAAKTFYFGVGGGTKTFLRNVADQDQLDAEVVHAIKEGVQREIICIRKR